LPKTLEPQSYSVSVRIASRIAIEKRMKKEMPFDFPIILKLMQGRTAIVSVKYIDYVVARSFLNAIDEWFSTLKKCPCSKCFSFIKKNSSMVPLVCKYSVGIISGLILLRNMHNFITPSATLLNLGQVIFCYFIGLFAIYKLANHLGRQAERMLDSHSELSYLRFNAGDNLEIDTAQAGYRKSLAWSAVNFVFAILSGIIVKLCVEMVLRYYPIS
jgi:hypothetical protein